MKKSQLKKYAKLVVKMGVNVRKGQEVVISAALDQPEFVTMVAEEAYKAGASRVTVEWGHQPLARIGVNYMSLDMLGTVPEWQKAKMQHYVDKLPAQIHIMSQDPDGLKGIDQAKAAQAQVKTFPILKPYRDAMENKYQWTIVAVPGEGWAKKVFPDLPKKKAIAALWDAILTSARITDNPIKAWKEHNADIQKRCDYLDSLNLDYLHFKSPEGTDFKVWMIPEARWLGGGETTISGRFYNPNMPTEETFTTPMKGKAEGKVVASMPLSYKGELIEDFSVTFKDGKVSAVSAKRNQNLLEQMIAMDEGAKMLGEVALVPFESPIRQSGVLFYNTLFDENAACHLALGRGFSNAIKNYDKYTKEDFARLGVNESMIHVDFMIGTRELNITGFSRDGRQIPIFEHGSWAF
ncbi:MAG TPA: aminopeptidase [Bacilli bacterium]|nr:aminopeptidase [Bacilli bacterium]